ncbi:4-galactosyl-N-acetylglucosaminide 3-alpha-L-fucosyltransferase FUT6 [Choloepus didactylus]|uniref:4-galactosyl-N-acetylglucosaminide 3-alpha-L-fucosyltransferase FUT6 n=1 Tax=Choloepus didactylus TaxID=27675 RepID=UPI00189F7E9F|nr:4-galactosyl-N-acetylglucosaminide 3-alpha-L-fucosyltransferase FUT6 [Choloepus didactylus]
MDPVGWTKLQCPWRHLLLGLLFQLVLALCFFSYLHIYQDKPTGFSEAGPCTKEAVKATPNGLAGPPAHPPLVILLWTWPFNNPVALSSCSEMRPGTEDCLLTTNRRVYNQADAVIVHHREVSRQPQSLLPPSPRPPGQQWLWFSMESPSHCSHLKALDGYFNLTMSYRRDSDIFTPYGWLEPWPGQPTDVLTHLGNKTKLVAWVVSNWGSSSARVQYYTVLQQYLQVDVYGRSHRPLPQQAMMETLAQYKFYLAFENSLHPDYITEKLWRNALQAWAVPVVLGPSRSSYERFLPPEAFIHVEDFQGPQALAQYLQALDKDQAAYLRYFRWRETLRPRFFSWAHAFCKACWRLQEEPSYQAVPSIAAWFT